MNKTIRHSFSLLSCLKVQQNVGSFISIYFYYFAKITTFKPVF